MNTLTAIVAFLNRHDVCAGRKTVVSASETGIVVRSMVDAPDGSVVEAHDTLTPTMTAARQWLGY